MNLDPSAQNGFKSPASAFAQWYGILLGPIIFGLNLLISYAVVPHACSTGRYYLLHLICVASLVVIASAWFASWQIFRRAPENSSTEGGTAADRGFFLSIVGLLSSTFFFIIVLANWLPRFVLNPCDQ